MSDRRHERSCDEVVAGAVEQIDGDGMCVNPCDRWLQFAGGERTAGSSRRASARQNSEGAESLRCDSATSARRKELSGCSGPDGLLPRSCARAKNHRRSARKGRRAETQSAGPPNAEAACLSNPPVAGRARRHVPPSNCSRCSDSPPSGTQSDCRRRPDSSRSSPLPVRSPRRSARRRTCRWSRPGRTGRRCRKRG